MKKRPGLAHFLDISLLQCTVGRKAKTMLTKIFRELPVPTLGT